MTAIHPQLNAREWEAEEVGVWRMIKKTKKQLDAKTQREQSGKSGSVEKTRFGIALKDKRNEGAIGGSKGGMHRGGVRLGVGRKDERIRHK